MSRQVPYKTLWIQLFDFHKYAGILT